MGYQTIEFEVRGHTACVTLNRPEVLNAINDEMIAELAEVYAEVETSSDIWTLIITGAGRALCGAPMSTRPPTTTWKTPRESTTKANPS
ncbi:hypothetical protein MHIB_00220 [Mycolicibacter hiberniae]|uniref:Enoyl-CoA hydratase/isomerase domain-containing protein n=1 Tax=Mycolicibacter hiberniae TaxID=29314 RepID=A0A7I7WVQ3_9MYCO|nr:hypothetical protein MHIB_00220 [Mycolicibacter hiberniae]